MVFIVTALSWQRWNQPAAALWVKRQGTFTSIALLGIRVNSSARIEVLGGITPVEAVVKFSNLGSIHKSRRHSAAKSSFAQPVPSTELTQAI